MAMANNTHPKILIITYYWPPAGGPGVQRWLKLSKYLCDQGAQVKVITVHPDQATWPIRDEDLKDEVHSKVEVHYSNTFEPFGAYLKATGRKEVPYSGFANEVAKPGFRQRAAKFIRGNFFLPDARKGWNRYAYKKAKELINKEKLDAIITSGPPHSTHLIGQKLQKHFGVKWIADFRDPWTDIYYYDSLYPTKLARWVDKRWERGVLQNADCVLASSPYLTELLQSKVNRQSGFHFFPNGYDQADYPKIVPEIEKNHLIYTGTITRIYPLHGLIKALNYLSEDQKWTLDLFGKTDEELGRQLEEGSFEFRSHGFVNHSEAVKEMHNANCLLLVIPKMNPNKGIIPGKIFEYIGSGRPILGIGPVDSDAAKLVRETAQGEFFDYEDSEGMMKFLQNPKDYLQERTIEPTVFSRSGQAAELLKIIRSL
jgi:glycosyltransferase involved in cell wall biosynthesis